MDTTWGDLYTYPLFTHGGPYWQIVKIPFSKFYFSVYGRIQKHQRAPIQQDVSVENRWEDVNRLQHFNSPVRAVGVTLQDRIDGPFALELDWIGVYYDIRHFENCKYEMYKTEWFTLGSS